MVFLDPIRLARIGEADGELAPNVAQIPTTPSGLSGSVKEILGATGSHKVCFTARGKLVGAERCRLACEL